MKTKLMPLFAGFSAALLSLSALTCTASPPPTTRPHTPSPPVYIDPYPDNFFPETPPKKVPGENVKWDKWPAQKPVEPGLGKVLGDIESHLPAKYKQTYRTNSQTGQAFEPVTHGHETCHGISSAIAPMLGSGTGLYLMNDRAITLKDPKFTLDDVAALVPQGLRGLRFRMYLIGQQRQETLRTRPTYVFDEGVAYTNGIAVGLDRPDAYPGPNASDFGVAPVEFAGFYLAFVRACQRHDPNYLKDENFKEFLAHELVRIGHLHAESQKLPAFKWADTTARDTLASGPDGQPLRDALKALYGDDLTMDMLFPK